MVIFSRVPVPQQLETKAPPGTMLAAKKDWVMGECNGSNLSFPKFHLFVQFKMGHSSHMTVELIQLGEKNDATASLCGGYQQV